MTITLNKEELKEIVKKHLISQGMAVQGDIRVKCRIGIVGYGMGEEQAAIFDGFEAEVESMELNKATL